MPRTSIAPSGSSSMPGASVARSCIRGGGRPAMASAVDSSVAEGVSALPVPGHTRGSVLYLADDTYCFSGDSFYWSRTTGDLAVAESVTWYSVTELAASLARAAPRVRFGWVLPGHGDRKHLPPDEFSRRLRDLAARTALLRSQSIDFTALRW